MASLTGTLAPLSADDADVLALVAERMKAQKGTREEKLIAAIRQQWRDFSEVKDKTLLVQIGFASDDFFQSLLNTHPAKLLSDAVDGVNRAFDILQSSKTALIDLAGRFHYQLLHDSAHRVDLDALLRDATKEVYTYANAAESLVQAYRHIVSAVAGITPKYDALKAEIIGNARVVRFFKDLRNSNNHIQILEAAPHYSIRSGFGDGKREVASGLAFRAEAILNDDKWSTTSRKMASEAKHLPVVELVCEHFKLVSEFYRKVFVHVGIQEDLLFRDINKLKVARKSMSYRHSLAILLQIAVPKKLNPYEYLTGWFSEEELARAYALPDHSKEQLDYLISLRDPLGLCDTYTRSQLCVLFSVPSQTITRRA